MNNRVLGGFNVDVVRRTALKARQKYFQEDLLKSAKVLSEIPYYTQRREPETEVAEKQEIVLANNLGIIHLRLQNYAVALKFFQHALYYEQRSKRKSEESSLVHESAKRKSCILYNTGIAMLYLGRPKEAFECLLVALKVRNYNARVWFRLAEACIMFSDQANEKSNGEQPFAIPSPSYEFALLCLRNADVLNQKQWRMCKEGNHGNNSSENTRFISSLDYRTAKSPENLTISINAAFCYVSIRLEEYSLAYEYGMLLRKEKDISGPILYLANLYCAESLVLLNKPEEAHFCLDLRMCDRLEATVSGWKVKSAQAAQSLVYYNLVLVLILQGKLGAAYALLTNCPVVGIFNKLNVFKEYIENVFETRENRSFVIKKKKRNEFI